MSSSRRRVPYKYNVWSVSHDLYYSCTWLGSHSSVNVVMDYDYSDINDLMRSSMEVSSALDVFMRERQNAAKNQETALKAYESEMLHILAESRPDDITE